MGASRLETCVMATRCAAVVAVALSLFLPSVALAGVPGEPTTLPDIIAAVQKTYAGVSAIRSDFQQTIKNPITGVEEKQRGRIQLERPRKMRLEIGLPVVSAVVSDGTTQWLYSAQSKQVVVQKLLGGASGVETLIEDLGRLSELFDVTLVPQAAPPKPVHQLALAPKTAGGVKSLELTIRKTTYLLQDLVITDATGGVSRMSFTGMVLGGDVPDAQFTFKAPPGITVVQL